MTDESANPVQEAYAALFECRCGEADCTIPALLKRYVPDAARALALATFWRWRCCHIPCTPSNPCALCAERVAIIERLGR